MGWGPVSIMLLAAFASLLLWAGIEDVRRREIANWKNAAIALLAVPWWLANGLGLGDIAWQIGVALLLFAVFAGAFALGQMGGGDVKMIAAVALWLPLDSLLGAMMVMALAGGAITLAMVIERWLRRGNLPAPEIPYGVAIAIAGLLAIREPLFNQIA